MGCMQHCMHCHAATAQGPGTASALQQTARAATKEMETRDAAYLSLLEIRAGDVENASETNAVNPRQLLPVSSMSHSE